VDKVHALRANDRVPALQLDSISCALSRNADEKGMIRDLPSTTENLGEKWTLAFAVLGVTYTAKRRRRRSPEKRSRISLGILPMHADRNMFAASMKVEAAGS